MSTDPERWSKVERKDRWKFVGVCAGAFMLAASLFTNILLLSNHSAELSQIKGNTQTIAANESTSTSNHGQTIAADRSVCQTLNAQSIAITEMAAVLHVTASVPVCVVGTPVRAAPPP